ncbi:MAG: HD domain-containing protein [Candidatus Moranbacteria bacterium]|nr:HD domain-containing protein [Candidatus Moranbacteria bacterium]
MINDGWKKPALFHVVRVGTHLFEQNYGRDIVIAGFLHDVLEDGTDVSENMIDVEFGNSVLQIVKANSKNEDINDKQKKKEDLINRCIVTGKSACIVKAGDILDNFFYYEMTQNKDELLRHCVPHAQLLLSKLPDKYAGRIFQRLSSKMDEVVSVYI